MYALPENNDIPSIFDDPTQLSPHNDSTLVPVPMHVEHKYVSLLVPVVEDRPSCLSSSCSSLVRVWSTKGRLRGERAGKRVWEWRPAFNG